MSGRYELLVADPAFGSTIAMLACPGPAPRTMLDVSRASRVVADWLLTELNALLDRAEKAEARVAELEREVAAWSPARCYGEEEKTRASDCPIHGPEHTVPSRWTNGPLAPVRFICMKCSWVWEDPGTAKTAPQTPVPAPEGTETAQKAPPPSPAGAPRSDREANSAGQVGNPGPVLGHSRASESSNLDTLAFGKSVPVPPARPCEGCKGVTDSPEASLCPTCRLWWLKQGFAEVEEPRPVVSCSDARCQCYQCVKGRADEEEDFAQLAKEQAKRATTRVEASPAAAAEVEARTNAVEPLKKQVEAWRDAVLESIPKRRCEGCATGTALAAHSLCPACIREDEAQAARRYEAMLRRGDEFFRTPPRAGLPSRDEVAAFLEARWPGGWRVNVRDVRIYK